MKKLRRNCILLLFLCLFLMTTTVFAQDMEKSKPTNSKAASEKSITDAGTGKRNITNQVEKYIIEKEKYGSSMYDSDSYYLAGERPRDNETIKKGSKLYVAFYARDTWKSYYTMPVVSVFNSAGKCIYVTTNHDIVSLTGRDHYTGNIAWDTSSVAAGNYYVFIVAAPCYKSGTLVSNWNEFDCPYVKTYFKVTSSVTAPKATYFTSISPSYHSATIKWKSRTGITGYQLQWSKKSNFSSYKQKKLTATSKKYTITKLSSDTKYYVRIRTYKKKSGQYYYSSWKKDSFWTDYDF